MVDSFARSGHARNSISLSAGQVLAKVRSLSMSRADGQARRLSRLRSRQIWIAAVAATTSTAALADPVFTDAGSFLKNFVKSTLKTSGGTTLTVMATEVQKPGSNTEAMVTGIAPYTPFTDAQKAMVDTSVTAVYPKNVPMPANAADPAYDCHGLTFKSSKLRIDNPGVQKILDDQGWKPPADGKAKVGDIVVYRKDGAITHSGTVTAVDDAGKVTQVLSKWGSLGIYKHAPDDVPHGQAAFAGADYGTFTVYTGGKPLKDPPTTDDLSIFASLPPVTLKESLLLNNWIDVFPTPTFQLDSETDGIFDYSLAPPDTGLVVSPGDMLSLYASGITEASTPTGWIIAGLTPTVVTWEATSSADIISALSGFDITSIYTTVGDDLYQETAAGSDGIVQGPVVPEPATLTLLASACAIFAAVRRRHAMARVAA